MQCELSENQDCEDVKELRRQWDRYESTLRPRSLWMVCNDPVMDRVLERIRNIEPALVLRRHGNRLSGERYRSFGATSAIHYAVERLRVREIIICGHSMCSAFATEDDPATRRDRANGFEGLMQRICRREELNHASQENVVRELALLETQTFAAYESSLCQVEVHGLFYFAESGIFTRYDKVKRRFLAMQDSHDIGHGKALKLARLEIQRSAWQ